MDKERTVSYELTETEVNLILRGLGELRAKESIAMILKIQDVWRAATAVEGE